MCPLIKCFKSVILEKTYFILANVLPTTYNKPLETCKTEGQTHGR